MRCCSTRRCSRWCRCSAQATPSGSRRSASAPGFTVGADLALPSAIQADVIDVDTARSGEQRSGLYFATWSLSTKLSLALGVGIIFPLLGLFGFDPAPGAVNSATALAALTATYAWLPLVLKLDGDRADVEFPARRNRAARIARRDRDARLRLRLRKP